MKNNNSVKVLISLILVLSACSQAPPEATMKTPNPVQSNWPPEQSPVPATTPTPVVKPYTMPDLKKNFVFLDPVPLSNWVPAVLDDNGNGMFIFKGSGIKISNFQPSGELFTLDTDFGDASLSLDEKGNGLVIWDRAGVIGTGDNPLPPEFFYIKYKKIMNYKPVGEAIKTTNQELNFANSIKISLDENGNGRIFSTKINDNSIIITSFPVNGYVISETKEKSVIFEGKNIFLDKNGNGFLQRNKDDGKIALVKIQNLIADPQEMIISLKGNNYRRYNNLVVDFDLKGNGFIAWTNDYTLINPPEDYPDRSELIIKKLSEFTLTGEEINLGADYINIPSINMDHEGNGIVVWTRGTTPSDIYVREIKKYIPQNPIKITNDKDFKSAFGIIVNKFGDGLITWQHYSYVTNTAKFYARLVTDYTIARDETFKYTPLPRPTPSPVPCCPPRYTLAPDGKMFEPVTINGNVSNSNGIPLSGVTVSIKSFSNSSVVIPEQTTLEDGHYLIRLVPVGNIEITASKAGYKTRSRMVTVESNQEGNPEKNKFNFTGDFALLES